MEEQPFNTEEVMRQRGLRERVADYFYDMSLVLALTHNGPSEEILAILEQRQQERKK